MIVRPVHVALADKLIDMITSSTDGTIGVQGQELPTRGYYVGGVTASLVNPSTFMEVARWVAVAVQRADYLGVWTDEDGTVYVDASELAYGVNNALALAEERGELAVWDILDSREIRTDVVTQGVAL